MKKLIELGSARSHVLPRHQLQEPGYCDTCTEAQPNPMCHQSLFFSPPHCLCSHSAANLNLIAEQEPQQEAGLSALRGMSCQNPHDLGCLGSRGTLCKHRAPSPGNSILPPHFRLMLCSSSLAGCGMAQRLH